MKFPINKLCYTLNGWIYCFSGFYGSSFIVCEFGEKHIESESQRMSPEVTQAQNVHIQKSPAGTAAHSVEDTTRKSIFLALLQ